MFSFHSNILSTLVFADGSVRLVLKLEWKDFLPSPMSLIVLSNSLTFSLYHFLSKTQMSRNWKNPEKLILSAKKHLWIFVASFRLKNDSKLAKTPYFLHQFKNIWIFDVFSKKNYLRTVYCCTSTYYIYYIYIIS